MDIFRGNWLTLGVSTLLALAGPVSAEDFSYLSLDADPAATLGRVQVLQPGCESGNTELAQARNDYAILFQCKDTGISHKVFYWSPVTGVKDTADLGFLTKADTLSRYGDYVGGTLSDYAGNGGFALGTWHAPDGRINILHTETLDKDVAEAISPDGQTAVGYYAPHPTHEFIWRGNQSQEDAPVANVLSVWYTISNNGTTLSGAAENDDSSAAVYSFQGADAEDIFESNNIALIDLVSDDGAVVFARSPGQSHRLIIRHASGETLATGNDTTSYFRTIRATPDGKTAWGVVTIDNIERIFQYQEGGKVAVIASVCNDCTISTVSFDGHFGGGFRKVDDHAHAILWVNGKGVYDLGTLGGSDAWLLGVADDGSYATGYVQDSDGAQRLIVVRLSS